MLTTHGKLCFLHANAAKRRQGLLTSIALLAVVFAGVTAQAATYTWKNGASTTVDATANWSGLAANFAAGDTAYWDGVQAGSLSLSLTEATVMNPGAPGINYYIDSGQTSPLTINSSNATATTRIDSITINPGAGAFTLGSASLSTTVNTTLGGAGTIGTLNQTAVICTNNSSNTATFGANVFFNNSSAATHGIILSGTGNWAFNAAIQPHNGAQVWLQDAGTGVVTYAGTTNGAGVVEVGSPTAGNSTSTFNIVPGASLAMSGGSTSGGPPGTLNAGMGSGNTGIINQSGGTVSLTTAGWNLELGEVAGAYGYYNMTGGSLYCLEAEIGNNGYGYYNQSGGSATFANWFLLARAGTGSTTPYGVANITGGQLLYNGGNNFVNTWTGLGSSVNVSGSGFLSLGGNNVLLGGIGIGGVLNVNSGGTLQTSAVKYNNGTGALNFNGGVMIASSATTAFITNNANIATTVYAGGGTISNNGLNIGIPAALLAPSGSGVSSIQVSGTGFTAPPLVYISGGNGTYATGVATIDNNGNLTGINITNPGINYTSAPALTLYGGGGTLLSSTVNLSAFNSGGMTFQGSGTTALTGANTYSGPTTVTGGLFLVNGSPSGGGNYTIQSGATLAGTGSITNGGTVSLASGANLAPGNNATTGNVGTLTVPGLVLSGGGTGYFDISGTNTTPGSNVNDQVSAAGNISLSGTTNVFVNVVDNGGFIQTSGTSSYALFSYGGSVSGFTASSFTLSDTGILTSRQRVQFVNNTDSDQIDLNIIGVAGNLTWVGSNAASWDNSGGTTNWFNSNSNVNGLDKFVAGDNVTFAAASAGPPVVSGSGIVTINGAVAPGSVTVSGGNYTFSGTGKITNVTALTVQSGAALVIANTNDYSGGTQLQGGLIALATNNALPTSTVISASGGTLDMAGHIQQIGGLSGYGSLITASSGNSTLTYANSALYSYFSGTIADTAPGGGTLGLTVSAGTLDVTSGATNYFGPTTVTGSGALFTSSLPNTSSYSVGPSGSLSITNAQAAYGANYSNSGSVTFGNSSGTIAMTNAAGGGITSTTNLVVLNVSAGSQGFGGSAALYKSTAGTLVLTGNSTYTGGTTFNSGTIQAGPGSSQPSGLGVGDFVWTNPANSAVLDLNGQNISLGAISQPNASTTNVITNSASGTTATLTVGSNGDTTTFAGVLQNGAGTLALSTGGAGMFTLTNTNTYTGGTFVGGGGTLSIPHSYSLPYGTLGFNTAGGTLSVPFALTAPGLTFAGSQTMYAAISAPSVSVTGSALQLGSSVSGAGLQTFDLTAVPTFVYSASAQSFNVGGAVNAAPAASATMLMAATNTITAASFGVGAFTNENFSAQNTGTVELGQMNTINASSITVGYNKNVAVLQFQPGLTNPTLVIRNTAGNGRASLVVATDSSGQQPTVGTIDLVTGVTGNSILDAMISSGTIGTTTGGAMDSTGTFLMGGGTLDATSLYVGQSQSAANNIGTFSTFGGLVKIGTLILGDQHSTGSATGNITLDGGGTLTATSVAPGAGSGTQNFYWNNGTIANYNTSGSTTGLTVSIPTITLASTGTHTLWIDAGQTGTINAQLDDGGGSVDLIKAGPGAAILTVGNNNYSGSTNVAGGTLKLSGTADINSSSGININGGSFINDSSVVSSVPTVTLTSGTLGGAGTLSNATVTAASSPGNAIIGGDTGAGTLTVNTLTFSGSGQIDVSFGSTQVAATTLNANGAAHSVVIQNAGGYPSAIGEYPLVQYSGSIGGTGSAAFILGGTLPPRTVAHLDFSNPGFIDYDITGVDYPVWTGSQTSTWSTGPIPGFKNWKLAIAGTATDFLTGDNAVFDDTAHTGNVQISAANVQPATVTFNNTALGYTITGPYGIADFSASQATTVSLDGSGLVVFATTNSYTGGTNIGGGTLQLGNGAANGSIAGAVTDNGVLAFNLATSAALAGAISGTGAVEISSGQMFLTGANQYAGGTTINGGTLNINADAALGTSPSAAATNTTFNHNGTLQFGANSISLNANRTIAVNGATATFDTYGNATTIAGAIVDGTGSGSISVVGTGSLTLTGSNTYSGTTYINAATLSIGNGGTGEYLASPSVSDSGTLVFNHTDALTYGGNISGRGALTHLGAGTLVLAGSNNYTGLTTIGGGFLDLPSTSALTGGGNISFQGGTLEYSATGATVLAGAVINSGASTMNFDVTAGTLQMSGNLGASNSGGLLVTGPGTLVVSNSNSYSGQTSIGTNQGGGQFYAELLATASQALGTGTISFDPGGNGTRGQLLLANNISLNNPITLWGRNTTGGNPNPINAAIENISGNNTLSGGITLQVGGTYILQSDSGLLTISGGTSITSGAGGTRNVTLQGNGNGLISGMVLNGSSTGLSLTMAGSGTWTISNTANAYTGGSFANSGVLQFTQTAAMPATGTVAVAGGAILAVNAGGTGEFSNATSGTGSIGGLVAGIGGQGAPVTWASGAILGIDATNAPGGLTYSGSIANTANGPLGLAELGSGTLTLSGSNTYTGGTDVLGSATLIVNEPWEIDATGVGTNLSVGSASLLAEFGTVFSPIQSASQAAPAPVPEPATWGLLAAAFGCLLLWRRRR